MTSRINESPGNNCYTRSDTRSDQVPMSSQLEEEGCQVIEESGTVCGETRTLSIFQEFRNIYDECLRKMEGSKEENSALRRLAPFRKLVEDLWEQNAMLVETVEELEQEATNRVTMLQTKLDKCCEKDIENLLRQKEREVCCLAKELSDKNQLLEKYYGQIDELRRDMKARSRRYQLLLNRLKDAAIQRLNKLPDDCQASNRDDLDETELGALFDAILKELDCKKTNFARRIDETNKLVEDVSREKRDMETERMEMIRALEDLRLENGCLRDELVGLRCARAENEELVCRLEQVKVERDQLLDKVNSLHQNIQELDTSYKETRWALTAEVAEKHDQIQDLKKMLACLEEQVRQADMKSLFKDDVIKEMRKELKSSRKSGRCGIYDVVTELTGEPKAKMTSPDSRHLRKPLDKFVSFVTGPSCNAADVESGRIECSPRPAAEALANDEGERFFDGMTAQGKLECLKQALKLKIQQMQDQGDTIQELECQLKKTKKDLACLKEKCSVRGRTEASSELINYEAKLQKLRDVLMCATQQAEKSIIKLTNCDACRNCTCREVFEDEKMAIQFVRRDLELLEIKGTANSNKCKDFSTDKQICKCDDKRSKSLSQADVDTFRMKAVIGMAAVEEMREQVDNLHKMIRKHLKQLPCGYEKSQAEECENKFGKLRAEFDEVAEDLCALVESFNATDEGIGRRELSSDPPASGRVEKLLAEEKRLREEICNQQNQLEKLKRDLKEVEEELCTKRCRSADHEREIKAQEQEISRLREGVKGFRERLKDLQIDITENLSNATQLVPSTGSGSNLSNLSMELQELCLILKTSQTSFPGIIEKCKEENNQMRDKLCRLEKLLQNKDETASILQQSLKMRDGQIEDLNCKLQSMNCEVAKLRQELEEKNRLICNLQDSMRKAKEFEEDCHTARLRMKDETIEGLQFEICDLDCKLKAVIKEVIKKGKDLEILQDEILYVSSKNFFLNREIDLLEPKLGKMQKNLAVYENIVCQLQNELKSREKEVESLYEKVREMEEEMECEMKRCERRSQEDSECISELENELKVLRSQSRKLSPDRASRSSDNNQTCDESEDSCQVVNLRNQVCQLKGEVKALKRKLKQAQRHEEINSKVAEFENIIRQGELRQQQYNVKICELQKLLEETVSVHECEKRKMMQKLCMEEKENVKNKLLITELNESIKSKAVTENTLKATIKRFTCELEAMRVENKDLRARLEGEGNQRLKQTRRPKRVCGGLEEIGEIINDLEAQKSDLKTQCCNLQSELENEEKIKKCLEEKIAALNDKLEKKTLQLNNLSQTYLCTSAKAQEALTKLKDAEDRLKCMNTALSKRRICDEEEADEDAMIEKRELENSLVEKTAECSDLMSEVQCLQVKLKTMQGEFISSQANKDCEVSRLNREITRLESEMDLLEKDNCKLWDDLKKAQDELKKRSRAGDCYKEELDKKNKELSEAACEKKALLDKVEGLQKRLEEMCMDKTTKENENRELQEELEKLKKEICEMECELCEMRRDLEALQAQYTETSEKLKSSEKKALNFKKLYCRVNQENAHLQELKSGLEKDLSEMNTQNFMLKEKLQCMKKQEMKRITAENMSATQEKMRQSARLKELTNQVRNLEENVIPFMEDEIARKDSCIESYKMELQEANASSQRMRDESLRVIQCTKKYLNAQRCANDALRSRSDCSKDIRHYGNNENRDLEDQLKSVTRMNEHLYFELQNEKNNYHDTEPRSFSPLPWGCSNVERDDSSPEYMTESGFQSMQPSPTNMNYINDYCPDMKRTPSQWNTNIGRHVDSNDYSPCRGGSVR